MVTKAVYDSDGNKLALDPKHKIYFLSNDLSGLTRRTTKDIKPGEIPVPNRRTYGPALSGKFLDRCLLFGSMALVLVMLLFSVLGLRQFIDLSLHKATLSLIIPLLIGSIGVFMNFIVGELDRKKLVKTKSDRPYKFSFILSLGIIIFAIVLGGFMNPQSLSTALSTLPYIAVGVVVFVLVSIGVLIYSTRGFSSPLVDVASQSHSYLSLITLCCTGKNVQSWLTVMDAPDDIAKILGPNEKVELYIKQKIYHPQINIDSVVFTNERMILRHPHALGLKKDYTDYNYRDIANVVLDKGILRSTIKCTLRLGGEPLALGDLPNSEAEKAYGIIRESIGKYQTPFSTGYASTSNAPDASNAPK